MSLGVLAAERLHWKFILNVFLLQKGRKKLFAMH